MRTMRLALDRFIESGAASAASGFEDTVARTLRDSSRFRDIVARSAFQLAYQPVVSLATGELHHFEALARFSKDTSPAETIQLAEDLDMIQAFDLSVVRAIVRELQAQPKTTRIAANLSAHSLMIDGFLEEMLGLVGKAQDLDRANGLIARLRKAGHVVCLDDFGAGAASLDYLRRLEVDFIKIDGRYIQSMTEGSRDALVVKHLVALCRELGVATIAEMVETDGVARLSRDLGVELGQGWVFSKPLDKPKWKPPAPATKMARTRPGSRDVWG
jgi:EAL domain-containing protein (putative c-di-GMP-specific phosphodiesterase class I)